MKIIVTDADSRKGYDIINILKNLHGYELVLFASSGNNLALPAIYGQKVHQLNVTNSDLFKQNLNSALELQEDTAFCYMAVSEKATLCFYDYIKNEENYADRISSMLPNIDAFQLARNKKQFQEYCEQNQHPVPKSYGKHNLSELEHQFRPVIAKKNVGTGSVGMIYVEKKEDLDLLNGIDHDSYLVQEKIESDKNIHGGFYLCKDGETISYHGHRRIRTFPEKGGVTVYSSTDDTEEIQQIGEDLLRELSWNGFAMIEFMYDVNAHQWKIIELNPRLWGSVMLSEYCGAALLGNYVRLCENEPPKKGNVLTERYIRWLFPFEFLNLIKGNVSFRDFLNLDKKKICYINFTYGGGFSNLLFQLFFTFNIRSVTRYFKKIFS